MCFAKIFQESPASCHWPNQIVSNLWYWVRVFYLNVINNCGIISLSGTRPGDLFTEFLLTFNLIWIIRHMDDLKTNVPCDVCNVHCWSSYWLNYMYGLLGCSKCLSLSFNCQNCLTIAFLDFLQISSKFYINFCFSTWYQNY
jgi:hypothetical protein